MSATLIENRGNRALGAELRAKALRILFLLAGALAINLTLFFLMERLSAGYQSGPVLRSLQLVDFVRLKREAPPPKVEERVEPPEPQQPEQTPEMPIPKVSRPIVEAPSAPIPRMKIPMNVTGGPYIGEMAAMGMREIREAVPLVRTPPLYPPHALARRIEGLVQVEFLVAEDGSVRAPKIVYAKPPGFFERTVLSALRHWKFERKLVDGKPVQWRTLQTVRFRLQDEKS
ncbi:MAG: energy transducer TonB [Pseudomonadota bacterium]|nr:energy transducer TonB [Pseudomonadota bacterium]